jgi:hypothetical protein
MQDLGDSLAAGKFCRKARQLLQQLQQQQPLRDEDAVAARCAQLLHVIDSDLAGC